MTTSRRLFPPVIAAPMAGGPSTPELVEAVGRAGGLGFLAAGYKSPEALDVELLRLAGAGIPYGVNVFVPETREPEHSAVLAYRERLRPEAERLGVRLPEPRWVDDDFFADKLELLMTRPAPVVSFTFGLPPAAAVSRLKGLGTLTVQTVTSATEALAAAELGVDALTVQHPSAGGHSGAFLGPAVKRSPTELLADVRSAVGLPLLAAGGIGTVELAREAFGAGAISVQLGTAFLLAPEAGTRNAHREALGDPSITRTALTRAFSGKWARGLENRFLREFEGAPEGYPTIHHLTTPLRAASAAAGDPGGLNLWAGTEWREARADSAASIVERFGSSA